jgi:hypothetical protein
MMGLIVFLLTFFLVPFLLLPCLVVIAMSLGGMIRSYQEYNLSA